MAREISDLEIRFAPPADDGTLEALAVRWETVDSYQTMFARGSVKPAGRSVPMLWSHSPSEVIGSWTGFTVTDEGLAVRGKLNLEVGRAREVRAMLLAGDVSGVSIGFLTEKDERRGTVRRITRAALQEISLVALPSVPGSRVTAIRSDRDGAAVRIAEAARAAVRAIRGSKP